MPTLAAFVLSGLALSLGLGNVLIEKPLSEQFKISDIVLVAKAEGIEKCTSHGLKCVKFKTIAVFKSDKTSIPADQMIVLNVEISESGLEKCCDYGNKYLLLLERRSDGYLEPVNEKYSVLEIR